MDELNKSILSTLERKNQALENLSHALSRCAQEGFRVSFITEGVQRLFANSIRFEVNLPGTSSHSLVTQVYGDELPKIKVVSVKEFVKNDSTP